MLKRAEIEPATATATALGSVQGKGARGGVITAREIEAGTSKARSSARDVWLTDSGARGQGRFTIRCTPAGARVCMYRYTRVDGTRDILKVADYDPRGVSGMTLHEARARAGELARMAGVGKNLRATLDEQNEAKVAAAAAVLRWRCGLNDSLRVRAPRLGSRHADYPTTHLDRQQPA